MFARVLSRCITHVAGLLQVSCHPRARQALRCPGLFVEPLEDRSLPSVVHVNAAAADVLAGSGKTISVVEARLFNRAVATFSDSNPTLPAGSFTASIDWGDRATGTGTVSGAHGSFTVNGSHTYAEEGVYTIQVTLTEDAPGGATATVAGTCTVTDRDVLAGLGKTITATEGTAFSGTVASFSDANSSTMASGLTAIVNWGDGTSSTGTVNGSAGSFTVSGNHTYTDEGTFTLHVTLADAAPGTATRTVAGIAHVAEADLLTGSGQTIAATEGTAFSGTVASFSDANLATIASGFIAIVNWGDGASSPGTVSGANGAFTVSGSHTYAEEGTFTIRVTLTDKAPGTVTATVTGTANVSEGDVLTGTGNTIVVTAAGAFSGAVASFIDTDTATSASGFTATIDWGDGTSSSGTVVGSSGSFTVSGSHTYATTGPYTPQVTLTDKAPGTATATVDVGELTGSGQAIAATEATAFSGAVATFSDTDPTVTADDFTALIIWGDGTSSAGIVSGSSGAFTVSGSHIYATAGSYPVQVALTETANLLTAMAAGIASIADAGLSGAVVTVVPVAGEYSGEVATFTDADTGATPADYSATIDWGDGTTSAGTIAATAVPGQFVVNGSHAYSVYGDLPIGVTIHHPITLMPNGGFEAGGLAPWTAGFTDESGGYYRKAVPVISTGQQHTGTHSILLGTLAGAGSEPLGDSWVKQTLVVPAGSPTLSFWYYGASQDSIAYDWQELQIQDTGGHPLAIPWKVCANSQTWTQVNVDLSRFVGRTVVLYFDVHQDGYGDVTSMYLDDVELSTAALNLQGTVNVPHTQPTNVLVNDPTEDGLFYSQNTQSETTLVLGANNTVVVGFNDSGLYDGSINAHFTGYSVSTDGGASFSDQLALPPSTDGDVGDPSLARDAVTGRIYFATLDLASAFGTASPGVYVFHSDDNGNTFQTPVKVGVGLESSPYAFYDKDWITVDNAAGAGQGTVYLVFRDFGYNDNGIFLTRSTDQGNTWSKPVAIAAAGAGNVQGAWVTTGPNHEVYVFWLDETGSRDAIEVRTSTNLGATFSPAVTVVRQHTQSVGYNGDLLLTDAYGNYFRSNTFPEAVVNPVTGAIYVTYDDKGLLANDKGDVFFTQSTDGGQTWSAPIRVNDDTTANDQWQPAIAVAPDGAHVGIFWYDRRLDPADNLIDRYGVVGTVGANNAITFGANFRITDVSFAPAFGSDWAVNATYMGDYDQAVADNHSFYVSWGDNRLGNPDVRFATVPVTGLDGAGNGSAAQAQAAMTQAQALIQALAASSPTASDNLHAAAALLAGAFESGWTPGDWHYLAGLLSHGKHPLPVKGEARLRSEHDGGHEGHDFADPGWMVKLQIDHPAPHWWVP
jgi:hypothetical protein